MISCPKAQTAALRLGCADRLDRVRLVDARGLEEVDPELPRGVGGRWRGHPAAPAPAPVRRGDDEGGAMRRIGEPPEDRGGEIGGAEVDGAHVVAPGGVRLVAVLGRRLGSGRSRDPG